VAATFALSMRDGCAMISSSVMRTIAMPHAPFCLHV
jgi:hypothetical protein